MKDILKKHHLFFEKDHLFHAYLIEGKDRKLVEEVLFALAKRILCDFGGLSEEVWSRGNLADLYPLEADEMSMDHIRDLLSKIYNKPSRGKYAIFLLKNVDSIRPDAQNALLKSLEEPPSHLIWLLGTSNAQMLLPTILSRLQCYKIASGAVEIIWEENFLRMMEKALLGDLAYVIMQRSFYEEEKDKEDVFVPYQNYLSLLWQYKRGLVQDLDPSLAQSFAKICDQVQYSQLEVSLDKIEEMQGYEKVNINRTLALESLLLGITRRA